MRSHRTHQLQKKHLKEFREDRRQRGFNNVPHDGKDLDESDQEDFFMPPLTDEDFRGWVRMPPPFGTEEEDGARPVDVPTDDEEVGSDGSD